MSVEASPSAGRLEFADSYDAGEYFFEHGWTDGLPVVPPTEERVNQFLDVMGLPADEIVVEYALRSREVSAEKIAANAVMAGCKPEYMPIVVAACKAVTSKQFALNHIAGLGSPYPLIVVNGPLAQQLGFNSGGYVFGPGNRPNATVGRALSLILSNCFDARVGGIQRGQMGNPIRWTGCIGENEETSWSPLHTERGFDKHETVVTIFPTVGFSGFRAVNAQSAEHAAASIAAALGVWACMTYNLFILSPPYQEIFARDGWTKDDVRHYLFENATATVAELKRQGRWQYYGTPDGLQPEIEPQDEHRVVHLLQRNEFQAELWREEEWERTPEIAFVVAGGDAGRNGILIPTFNMGARPVSQRVL